MDNLNTKKKKKGGGGGCLEAGVLCTYLMEAQTTSKPRGGFLRSGVQDQFDIGCNSECAEDALTNDGDVRKVAQAVGSSILQLPTTLHGHIQKVILELEVTMDPLRNACWKGQNVVASVLFGQAGAGKKFDFSVRHFTRMYLGWRHEAGAFERKHRMTQMV